MKISLDSGSLLFTGTFLVLLYLKLTENIDWSWWWITAPIWIPVSIGILIFTFLVICELKRS